MDNSARKMDSQNESYSADHINEKDPKGKTESRGLSHYVTSLITTFQRAIDYDHYFFIIWSH